MAKVLSVSYRDSTVDQANLLNLSGRFRNFRDGRVELVGEGPKASVESLLRWSRQCPANARVRDVQVDWLDAEGLSGGLHRISEKCGLIVHSL